MILQDLNEDHSYEKLELPISFQVGTKEIPAFTFIDNGCTSLTIHPRLVEWHNIPTRLLSQSRQLFSAVDKSTDIIITHETLPLRIKIGWHVEQVVFLVAKVRHNMILGLPWLRLHNPQVDWRVGTVTFRDVPPASNIVYLHQ